MYSTKTNMLTNDIELLLAEHKCTIDEVEEIVKGISDDVKVQKKADELGWRWREVAVPALDPVTDESNWEIYRKDKQGLRKIFTTDYYRKEIPAVNIADINVLNFVNVK